MFYIQNIKFAYILASMSTLQSILSLIILCLARFVMDTNLYWLSYLCIILVLNDYLG